MSLYISFKDEDKHGVVLKPEDIYGGSAFFDVQRNGQ